MNARDCLALANAITDDDRDAVLEQLDTYLAAGIAPEEASRRAVDDLMARVAGELEEARGAVREQHAALFEKPKGEPVSQFFGAREAPVMARGNYDTSTAWYHGTSSDVAEFSRIDGGNAWGRGIYVTEDAEAASGYAMGTFGGRIAPTGNAAPNVMKLYLRKGELFDMKAKAEPKLIRALEKALGEKLKDYTWPGMLNRDVRQMLFQQFVRDQDEANALLRRLGYIGLVEDGNSFGGKGRMAMVFDAANVKSATGNSGAFDPSSRDIRLARDFERDMAEQAKWLEEQARELGFRSVDDFIDNDFDGFTSMAQKWREENPLDIALARPPGGYRLPAFSAGAQIAEALQDRYNRWRQVVDAIREQGGVVNEANDFYRAEERYWGAVGSRIEDFNQEVSAFIDALRADGLTLKDVQLYAYAKHAKERNAYMRSKRDAAASGFDSWSGMSDDDADAILADAAATGFQPDLEKHHKTLMGWVQGTRDIMLDEGLITDEQWLLFTGLFDNYVPLRGRPDGAEQRGNGTGSGFNIRGKEAQRARGRYSEADNIIEHIIQDRVRTLTRAGKNQVLRSFLRFVLDNPDPQLWEVNAVERRPVFTVDAMGNQVIEEVNQVIKDGTTVGVKDGGREVFIQIKDEALLAQMRNLNVEQLHKALGFMLAAQRMMGRLYTSLSPTFTVINWARDTQAATMGMLDESGFRGAARLWMSLPGAMMESFRAEFGSPSPDYQLFRAVGGKTGFMDFKQIDELAEDITAQLANAYRSPLDPRRFGPAALELIEKVNAGIENATRFAAFKAARAEGQSVARAAQTSKNITVNFNRKGTWAPQLGSFFLFFNPAVQGSVRVAQALKSPKVLAVLGGAMAGVALLALRNAGMGEDDDGVIWWDKIPQEVKDRNLVIVLPPGATAGEQVPGSREGRYIKIPMPYGWNFFATIANQAVAVWLNSQDPARGVRPTKAMSNVVSSFLGAYMPVQELARSVDNPKSAVLAFVPDFANPVAQSLMNVNSFGRQMYPEGYGTDKVADAARYFPGQAGTIFQRTAKGLNDLTGGNDFKSGWLDFTPGTIENLVRAYGGGPASFTLDLMNAAYVRQSIERPDLDVRRLPFTKQVYGRIDAETDRMLAYERLDEIAKVVEPVDAARKAGQGDVAEALAKDAGPLLQLGGVAQDVRKQLSELRKRELKIISGDDSEAAKYALLKELERDRRQVLQKLNAAYNDAARSQR